MGKDKKKTDEWVAFLQGSMTALWIYLAGIFLAALLLMKGILPGGAMFPVVAGLCTVASLAGGLLVGGKTSWGTLPASVLNAAIFSGVLILTGILCWHGISWRGNGGVLLTCALVGGVLAGVLARPGGKRKKRGKIRKVGK